MTTSRHPSLSLLSKPFVVMGVVNVTPDSFYDGGRYATREAALEHALKLVDEGADVVDVGGESTRPGAAPVTLEEEIGRVVPVVGALRQRVDVAISIDTNKAGVAQRALDAGATWINDVSAGRFDGAMPHLAAQRACPVVLMHSRNTPKHMQQHPHYGDVVEEVRKELSTSIELFTRCGVNRQNIIIDPGIGFAKRLEDNIALLKNLPALAALGFPILVGASRKSFIAAITSRAPHERLAGSLAGAGAAFAGGAKLFRVHDVKETVDFLKVLSAIYHA